MKAKEVYSFITKTHKELLNINGVIYKKFKTSDDIDESIKRCGVLTNRYLSLLEECGVSTTKYVYALNKSGELKLNTNYLVVYIAPFNMSDNLVGGEYDFKCEDAQKMWYMFYEI